MFFTISYHLLGVANLILFGLFSLDLFLYCSSISESFFFFLALQSLHVKEIFRAKPLLGIMHAQLLLKANQS